MDAYDLYHAIKHLWAENSDKRSGCLEKSQQHMAVMINTECGYREVVGLRMNKDINAIELILDQE
jgi:hypothetical protein